MFDDPRFRFRMRAVIIGTVFVLFFELLVIEQLLGIIVAKAFLACVAAGFFFIFFKFRTVSKQETDPGRAMLIKCFIWTSLLLGFSMLTFAILLGL